MNIVLAGMPGSGKTTISRLLAEALNMRLIDTDEEIVKKYGAITDIFDKFGEECFRNLESQVVNEVCGESGAVISTGGGTLLRPENRAAFKNNGKIVYLKTGVENLVARVGGGEGRPLIAGDAQNKIRELYIKRAPVYETAADITVETDGVCPEDIAALIAERIK